MQKLVPPSWLPLPPVFLHWEDVSKGLNTMKGNLPSLSAIFDPALGAPALLYSCVQYIRKNGGLRKEGLFRTAGDQVTCNLAQTRWQNGVGSRPDSSEPTIIIGKDGPGTSPSGLSGPSSPPHEEIASNAYLVSPASSPSSGPDLSQLVITDIDTVAQILKMILRDLEEPLITFDAFERILHATAGVEAGGSENQWVETVNEALFSMPYEHQATLTYLIDFLADVAHESDVNKMTVTNLAIVFAPNVMRSRDEGRQDRSHLQIIAEARLTHKALERIIVEETSKHAMKEQEAFKREIAQQLGNRDTLDISSAFDRTSQRRNSKIRYVRSVNNAGANEVDV
jgi:hypothetical protein